jgi:hypothetical protein
MNLFAQLRKVDEAKRLVYGRLAQETVDKADEIMDYASSKPHFEKWSADVAADTDGKSVGNLRAMHGKVAAGKFTEIEFNDAERAIDVCAKVVDDNEWKKVLEGVYTGFSIGGSYVGSPTVEKMDGRDVKRYTAKPAEGSLVDRPCIPSAKFFEVQKADGSLQKVDFAPVPGDKPEAAVADIDVQVNGTADEVQQLGKLMNEQGLSIADVIAKVAARDDVDAADKKRAEAKYGDVDYADEKNKKYPLDTEEHVKAAASYFGKESNRAKYDAEDQKKIDGKIAAAKKKFKIGDDAEKADFVLPLRKGLYTCGTLARILQDIEYIKCSVEWETETEGDGSALGSQLVAWLAAGGKILQDMVAEEVAEATSAKDDSGATVVATPEVMEMSERAGALSKALDADLAKVEARAAAAKEAATQVEKAEPAADLAKLLAENAPALEKLIAEKVEPLTKALDEANAKIKKLEEQPAPARVSLRAVSKGDDRGGDADKPVEKVAQVVDSRGEVHESASLIKSLHQSGGQPFAGQLRK